MGRYLRLLGVQLRASLQTAMRYRGDFLLSGLMSLWWLGWTLVPVLVVFGPRASVAGWSMDEALVVMAWFTLLRGFLEGVVNPSLIEIVSQIRSGTLDFYLLKPADAQFLVSTAKFQPWKLVDVGGALVMVVVAFARLGRVPSAAHVLAAAGLLVCAAAVLYAIWLSVVCAAFYVVKLDNLAYLFSSVFDAARWPIQVFRGAWRAIFTFVIPLAIMTTVPAMALLGKLELATGLYAVAGAVGANLLARALWTRAISRYTSASS